MIILKSSPSESSDGFSFAPGVERMKLFRAGTPEGVGLAMGEVIFGLSPTDSLGSFFVARETPFPGVEGFLTGTGAEATLISF